MAEQLLNRWKLHRWAIQSIGSRIKECHGKGMAQIVGAERGGELRCLTQLGNDLTNAAFGQRSALTEKEMPIWPATPGSNRFSPNSCPLAPLFSQVFSVFEVSIERLTRFLDQRDFAMLEPFATSNNEHAASGSYLHIGDLEGSNLRNPWTRIAEQRC